MARNTEVRRLSPSGSRIVSGRKVIRIFLGGTAGKEKMSRDWITYRKYSKLDLQLRNALLERCLLH